MLAPHAPQPDVMAVGGRLKGAGEEEGRKRGGKEEDGRRQDGGKTDLLLRFFGSSHFNEWIAVHYLWRAKSEARAGAAWVPRGGPGRVSSQN